jgi:hypothetical protein
MPSPRQLMQFKTEVWDPVMYGGSNDSDVGWGPMTGNASDAPGNPLASKQLGRGQLGYKLRGGDTYFREGVRPGQGLRPLPRFGGQAQQQSMLTPQPGQPRNRTQGADIRLPTGRNLGIQGTQMGPEPRDIGDILDRLREQRQ